MPIQQQEILAIVVSASFAAGLNVYATLLTLGLLGRFHALPLPPALHLIESWPVIIIAGLLFALEFFADKIPAFDLFWNALHTFIRIPLAAFMAWGASQQLSPSAQLAAGVLGGLIALASHGGKLAVRAAVTPSPEPLSNMALSVGEDIVAVSLTWVATAHPVAAAVFVAVCLVMVVFTIRLVVRAFRRLFTPGQEQPQNLEMQR
jgi:energy-converting hydrogenase Eha subunit E